MRQQLLSAGWELKQRNPDCALEDDFNGVGDWLPAQVLRRSIRIFTDRIPDPFVGLNEIAFRWCSDLA